MQPVFWHRAPCTSQWGAWHAVPICGLLLGPEIWDPKSSLPRGVRQRFSCPVSQSRSNSSTPAPTSFHTRRRRCLDRRPHQTIMKTHCVPHAEAPTSISNSPKRRQQAESRMQPAKGLSKQKAGKKQTTAGSRENAQCGQRLQQCLPECEQPDPPREITSVQQVGSKQASSKQEEAGPGSCRQHHAVTRIAGSRQAAGSPQAGSKHPGTATMSGGAGHRYHAPLPCSSTMSGAGDPSFAILGLPAC